MLTPSLPHVMPGSEQFAAVSSGVRSVSRSRWLLAGCGVLLVALAGFLVWQLTRSPGPSRPCQQAIDALTPDGPRTQTPSCLGSVALGLGYAGTPFGPSFWGQPLPTSTPLNTNSATYVNEILNDLRTGPHVSSEGYLATKGDPPLYVVPANQPRVPVLPYDAATGRLDHNIWTEQLVQGGIPIPADAVPGKVSDRTINIYQPSSGELWELWRARKDAAGNWEVGVGGLIKDVSQSDGIFPPHNGTAATGDSLFSTQIRIEELQLGQIDHPMELDLTKTSVLAPGVIPANTPGAQHSYSWPAKSNDGIDYGATAIPEGLRFRLPANLNLAPYHLTPVAHMIAVAAQKYGFIVMNTGPDVQVRLGNPQPYIAAGLPNPYKKIFGKYFGVSGYSRYVMANFPWNQLQALPYNYGKPQS